MAGDPLLKRSILGIVVASEVTTEERNRQIETLGDKLADAINRPIISIGAKPESEWFSELSADLTQLQSRSLLIFGSLLESAVTQISLSALLDGYDVFVVADFTQTKEHAYRESFLNRIRECGGTIVTMRQAVRELAANENETSNAEALGALLCDLDAHDGENGFGIDHSAF